MVEGIQGHLSRKRRDPGSEGGQVHGDGDNVGHVDDGSDDSRAEGWTTMT